jgi:hypothetical protein
VLRRKKRVSGKLKRQETEPTRVHRVDGRYVDLRHRAYPSYAAAPSEFVRAQVPLKTWARACGSPPLSSALWAERNAIGRLPLGEWRPSDFRQGPISTDAVGQDTSILSLSRKRTGPKGPPLRFRESSPREKAQRHQGARLTDTVGRYGADEEVVDDLCVSHVDQPAQGVDCHGSWRTPRGKRRPSDFRQGPISIDAVGRNDAFIACRRAASSIA